VIFGKGLENFYEALSMRTPVCTRSTSNSDSSAMCTNVPRYLRDVKIEKRPGSADSGGQWPAYNRVSVFPFWMLRAVERDSPQGADWHSTRKSTNYGARKLKQIEALGQPSYPTRLRVHAYNPGEFEPTFGQDGRALEIRASCTRGRAHHGHSPDGKAGFAHLQQEDNVCRFM